MRMTWAITVSALIACGPETVPPPDAAGEICAAGACGPSLGIPSWPCADGTLGGPTGACLRGGDGGCGWEIRRCPVPLPCGTIAGLVCPGGLVCVDIPGDGCRYPDDPDCGGQCVTPHACAGIAGTPCPGGFVCVDDPRDDCRPPTGADCGGLCVLP